jgi:hypothetical protein
MDNLDVNNKSENDDSEIFKLSYTHFLLSSHENFFTDEIL